MKRRYEKALLDYYTNKKNNSYYSEKNLEKLKDYLNKMHQVCHEIDAEFIIYFVPGAVAVSKPDDITYFPWDQDLSDQKVYNLKRPLNELHKIADNLLIPVVDLTHPLRKHPKQPVYFRESWHWNEEGHKAVAKAIAEDIIARGLIGEQGY